MEEQDYINLQTLLAKLRVSCLKEISDPNIDSKIRDKDMKIIRYVDYLRNNIVLKVNGGES